MSIPHVLEIGHDLFMTTLLMALPTLVVSLVVGLAISIFQTITSIQEQTLSFVPRLLAVGAVLVLTMKWLLEMGIHFTARMIGQASEVIR